MTVSAFTVLAESDAQIRGTGGRGTRSGKLSAYVLCDDTVTDLTLPLIPTDIFEEGPLRDPISARKKTPPHCTNRNFFLMYCIERAELRDSRISHSARTQKFFHIRPGHKHINQRPRVARIDALEGNKLGTSRTKLNGIFRSFVYGEADNPPAGRSCPDAQACICIGRESQAITCLDDQLATAAACCRSARSRCVIGASLRRRHGGNI